MKTETKRFIKILLPTLGAMLISCIYNITDTLVIGRKMGETGLGALNIALPIYSYLYALSSFLGVGASILFCVTEGRKERGDAYAKAAFIMLLVVGVMLAAVLNIFFQPVMLFLGGTKANIGLISQYGRFIAAGAPLIMLNAFMSIFLRAMGKQNLSMAMVVISGIVNLILDCVFVFWLDMGLKGAGLATIFAMLTGIAIGSRSFLFHKRFRSARTEIHQFGEVLKRGFPTLAIDFSFAVTITLFNINFRRSFGEYAVPLYGIACNTVMVFAALFAGVAASVQPLMSTAYGENNRSALSGYFRLGIITTAVLSIVLYALLAVNPLAYVRFFALNPSDELLALAPVALRLYGLCLLFIGLNFCVIIAYQATLKTKTALAFSLLRGLALVVIFMYLLPPIFNNKALWLVVPLSEVLTLLGAVIYGRIIRIRSKAHS